jgi:AcrR family transcriptional regulator
MLLDAAATLFARQGYSGTTVEEIVGAVGATRATFYLHFATKSDLAIAFHDVIMGYDEDHSDLLRIAARPTVGRLSEWLRGFIDHVARRPGYLVGLHAAWRADPRVREVMDQHFNTWVDGLADGLARARDCDPGHARLLATVLLRQLDILDEQWIQAHWEERGDELREMLAVMWLGALRS